MSPPSRFTLTTAALVSVLWGALALSAAAEEKPSADETALRKKLVGLWKGFVVEGTGQRADRGPVQLELTLTETRIKGKQFKGTQVIDHGEGSFELDLHANPPHLDGYQLSERGKRPPWLGIFELKEDTLKWCVAKKEAPKTFETVKGQFLMILKRAK